MNLSRITSFMRSYLSPMLIFSLLLFYIASGFSVKGFGYFVVLLIASLLLIACGITIYTLFGKDEKRGAFSVLQLAYWLILGSLLVYFVQVDFFWTKIAGESPGSTFERLRQILQIFYFSGFAISFVSLLIASMIRAEAREVMTETLTLGGLMFFLIALNYWSHIRPAAVDMTLMRKFSLSPESRELLRGIQNEVKISAFFTDSIFTDLYRDTELLLRDAASVNGKISYTFIDPLREKNLADEKKVDRIGTILIETTEAQGGAGSATDGKSSVPPTDKDVDDPKKKIKSTKFEILDEDAIKRLERELVSNILQVSGKKLNVFYSQGHEEKSVSGAFKDDTIESFDENLRALRHHIRQLSPSEGFPQKMPQADLVFVIGPRRDFSAPEKAALKKYFDDGGKLFIAVDPESAADFSFLLSPLKVKFAKERVHSDFAVLPDKTVIRSMNYSEHAITAPFVKLPEERKQTVFPGAGYLETGNESSNDYDVNYFLLSHFSSWIDKIPNGLRDDKKEPIASFKIGMAVKAKKTTGRLIFIGDSDFLVNRFIDMQQNKELAMRAVGWLAQDDKLTGIVAGKYDDEKVKLTGTRETVVFHLFLYIYPGIILLVGFFVVRAKRRRMTYGAGGV